MSNSNIKTYHEIMASLEEIKKKCTKEKIDFISFVGFNSETDMLYTIPNKANRLGYVNSVLAGTKSIKKQISKDLIKYNLTDTAL